MIKKDEYENFILSKNKEINDIFGNLFFLKNFIKLLKKFLEL